MSFRLAIGALLVVTHAWIWNDPLVSEPDDRKLDPVELELLARSRANDTWFSWWRTSEQTSATSPEKSDFWWDRLFETIPKSIAAVCYHPHGEWLRDVDTTARHAIWPNSAEVAPAGVRCPPTETDCSPEMSCYLNARQTLNPTESITEFLKEAVAKGAPALSKEAMNLLDSAHRAGSEGPRVEITPTLWQDVHSPGRGLLHANNRELTLFDFGEQLPLHQALRDQLQLPDDRPERRQCLLRCIAGGVLYHQGKTCPSMSEVDRCALTLREELHTQALCAQHAMGTAGSRIPTLEHELRTHVHDVLLPDHDRDYRVIAALAPEFTSRCRIVIMRVTYAKQATVEIILGAHFDPQHKDSITMYLVVHRGHMKLMEPPPEGFSAWLDFLQQPHPPELLALGSEELLQRAASQPNVVGAPVEAACRCCRLRKWSWATKHARLVGGDDSWRQVGASLKEDEGGGALFIVAADGGDTSDFLALQPHSMPRRSTLSIVAEEESDPDDDDVTKPEESDPGSEEEAEDSDTLPRTMCLGSEEHDDVTQTEESDPG
eukprot:2169532-Amphidinium_carterae.1